MANMKDYCLLCNYGCCTTSAFKDSPSLSADFGSQNNSSLTSKQLHVIFILRNLLEVPSRKLEEYLVKYGNPADWNVKLCLPCTFLVDQAKTIFELLLETAKKFRKAKHRIVETIKRSPENQPEAGEGFQSLGDEVRSFAKNYEEYEPFADPFIEGDAIAKQVGRASLLDSSCSPKHMNLPEFQSLEDILVKTEPSDVGDGASVAEETENSFELSENLRVNQVDFIMPDLPFFLDTNPDPNIFLGDSGVGVQAENVVVQSECSESYLASSSTPSSSDSDWESSERRSALFSNKVKKPRRRNRRNRLRAFERKAKRFGIINENKASPIVIGQIVKQGKEEFRCKKCHAYFESKDLFVSHCQFAHRSFNYANRRNVDMNSIKEVKEFRYRCDICKKQFHLQYDLRAHLIKVHDLDSNTNRSLITLDISEESVNVEVVSHSSNSSSDDDDDNEPTSKFCKAPSINSNLGSQSSKVLNQEKQYRSVTKRFSAKNLTSNKKSVQRKSKRLSNKSKVSIPVDE